ncbi:MAG: AIR synthase-related protein [Pseudomonadota bacterium]
MEIGGVDWSYRKSVRVGDFPIYAVPSVFIDRVEVRPIRSDPLRHPLAVQVRRYLRVPVTGAEIFPVYWIRSNVKPPDTVIARWAEDIFSDPVLQSAIHSRRPRDYRFTRAPSYVLVIRFKPGVTDNVGHSATEALAVAAGRKAGNGVRVHSGKIVFLYGRLDASDSQRIAEGFLANALIEDVDVFPWREFNTSARFRNQRVPEVHLPPGVHTEHISLNLTDGEWEDLSTRNLWALSPGDFHRIRAHFAGDVVRKERVRIGLGREPTDVEMEIIAQTWSEHCKHRIFNAHIDYTETAGPGILLGDKAIDGLFPTFIAGVTRAIADRRRLSWLISVFSDNAGVVRFDPHVDLCAKVETHNTPSALDPYGGALTGILGVNRDILGCGMGARPIANTDVFCFAPPGRWAEKELPIGLKHPRRILEGVHAGVQDGGNKSGIPTVNGAFWFAPGYAGKPLVFCGTLGILPTQDIDGRAAARKAAKVGDILVMAGGAIGKDGIHGATFSSLELTEGSPATAVQIGDPMTQKRLLDFILEARDEGLYSCITDNGAGGLSSSIGEMARFTNGARIDVARAKTKYPGLRPFELVVSESQERMSLAVPPDRLDRFRDLAERRGVEISVLGELTDSGVFQIDFDGKTVGCLGLDFLHEPPLLRLTARWFRPTDAQLDLMGYTFGGGEKRPHRKPGNGTRFLKECLLGLLARPNICSKESLVRRYDHEVQAATHIKPFVGPRGRGPSDAGVIWMHPHGGGERSAVAVGCGIQPGLSDIDTFRMAQAALDEAVRNCVAVGGDVDHTALVDNFCWPDPVETPKNPLGSFKLAQLVRACRGLFDLADCYGTPFVSGKDSMKNDFVGKTSAGKPVKISVPPTLLVTAISRIEDISFTVTSEFKEPGHLVYLLGRTARGLAGSELSRMLDLAEAVLWEFEPETALTLYRRIFSAHRLGLLRSCHDISEGGLLVAAAEAAIGSNLGVHLEIEKPDAEHLLEFCYGEAPGRFLVSVEPVQSGTFENHFDGCPLVRLGTVTSKPEFRVLSGGRCVLSLPMAALARAWMRRFM